MTTIENTVLMEHPWRQRVLALLPEANIVARIPDDFPEWEFIDTEIAKLGSLSHEQVDIAALQNGCLRLLESECKDMRIMVHLLRTLQHGGEPSNIALASTLLVDYVSHLGSQAWPQDSKYAIAYYYRLLSALRAVLGISVSRLMPILVSWYVMAYFNCKSYLSRQILH